MNTCPWCGVQIDSEALTCEQCRADFCDDDKSNPDLDDAGTDGCEGGGTDPDEADESK